MATHAEAAEFRDALDALAIAPHRVARWLGVNQRSVRRWCGGDRRIPVGVDVLVRLLAAQVLTIGEIEAVVAVPVRTNGGTEPAPPTPSLVEPTPKQSTLACAEAAIFADPSPTTAEKVYALTPEACRWPCGDPDRPEFRFCGDPVAKRPYCERHHAMAYVAPLTGSERGVRSGRGAHGWRSPTTKRLSTGVSTRVSTDPVDGSVDRSVDASIAAQAQDFRAL